MGTSSGSGQEFLMIVQKRRDRRNFLHWIQFRWNFCLSGNVIFNCVKKVLKKSQIWSFWGQNPPPPICIIKWERFFNELIYYFSSNCGGTTGSTLVYINSLRIHQDVIKIMNLYMNSSRIHSTGVSFDGDLNAWLLRTPIKIFSWGCRRP